MGREPARALSARGPARRRLAGAALGLVLLLAADQIVQHTLLADGELLGQPFAPFDPPLFTRAQRESLAQLAKVAAGDPQAVAASVFDPDLGWAPRPSMVDGPASFDERGARSGPDPIGERLPGVRRVMALGCSFTFGAEVDDGETWAYYVDAARADLEIANLGFSAYGLDQAFLRWERSGRALDPDMVWIGLLPGAALRATTHYQPLAHHWYPVVLFKPMFALDPSGALVFHPSPARSVQQVIDLLGDQRAFLSALGPSDPWIARAPAAYAPRGSSWTHRFALTRLALTWREARGRHAADHLQDPEGPVASLLRTLLLKLRDELRARGRELRLLVLPGRDDLQWAVDHGRRYWTPFVDALHERGVRYLDLTSALLAAGSLTSDDLWMPRGHYSPAANRVVADTILAEWLAKE